ncbi:MAG: Fic family protein [bacterium]
MNTELQQKLDAATILLARLDGMAYTLPNTDLFITMYLKKEALLSSQIEGTQASLQDVFEFEKDKDYSNINNVEEVANYIRALNYGIKKLKTFPMSIRLLKELHSILLKNVRGKKKTPGDFKKSQNWIGPAGCTLQDATFVPPPPEEAKKAISDLEKFIYKKATLPELINCALIHYQFETIHPFLDGNGRLGRLLITFYLCWKGVLQNPLLYLSHYFKKHRQEYYDRLNMVRNKGDYEQWISFFLDGIIEVSKSAIDNTKKILSLHENIKQKLFENKISSPLAIIFLDKLFYTPIISTKDLQTKLDISYQSAANLILTFEELEILKEVSGKKRDKKFSFFKYIEILSEGTKPL